MHALNMKRTMCARELVKVGLMLLAMLSSTFMLVAIMKYDVKAKDPDYPSFQRFWASRCDSFRPPPPSPFVLLCAIITYRAFSRFYLKYII